MLRKFEEVRWMKRKFENRVFVRKKGIREEKKERSLLQRDEVKENKLKAASKHTSTSIGKANDGRETRGNTKRNNVGRKK